jgi:DNA-directed RNA polymerase specialized sigma24 family protein
MSVEVGRLPSLLGREFFRTRVTSRQQCTFEDAVIFVHDVERSLERLDGFSQKVIARVVLQDYTREEAARLLGCCERQLRRTYCEALDHLSEIFLQGGLLKRE